MPALPQAVPDAVVLGVIRLTRRNRIYVDAVAAEAHLADRALRPVAFGPPRRLRGDVEITREQAQGWPMYRLTPADCVPRGTVIYAHGGGWVNEIVRQHYELCAQIAAEAQTTVLVPIYPLIPDGTAAAVTAGVADLAAGCSEHGPVVLAGDSAGGQIALSAAFVLRDRHHRRAERTVLISPGLDATLSNPAIDAVEPADPWLGRPGIRVFTERWRGDLPLEDPLVSPVYGDLAGLGPVTLFTGTRDILNPDARVLRDRAAQSDLEFEYVERTGLIHVYPLLPTAAGLEARRAIVASVARVVRDGGGQGSASGA